MQASYDVAVVGAGPAGLAAACLLQLEGQRVALAAPTAPADPRTVALMHPTLRLLEYLGIWPASLRQASAALRRQRIVDDTGSFFTSPSLSFLAKDMGLEAFAWNIPLQLLMDGLRSRAHALGVEFLPHAAASSHTTPQDIRIHLADDTIIAARLCIAADGARSIMRRETGIGTSEWSFDQSALVASFEHSASHDDTSTEYTREAGPCTVVPLPGKRSALVWMGRPDDIGKLATLPDGEFLANLQAATHGDLGRLTELSPRAVFPMRGLTATRFSAGRTLLAGEAAHVVPPIGAQGLNMSFRDVGLAADLIIANPTGSVETIVNAYDVRRRQEVVPRQQLITAMNKSLLLGLMPLDAARAAALWSVYGLEPLRRTVMAAGIGLSGQLPFAMRERPALS